MLLHRFFFSLHLHLLFLRQGASKVSAKPWLMPCRDLPQFMREGGQGPWTFGVPVNLTIMSLKNQCSP